MTMLVAPEISSQRLSEPEWRARQHAHEARVRCWTDPHQARAARGQKHPVYDFLFTYYAFRPAWLKRWHPGPDVVLGDDPAATEPAGTTFLRWPEYCRDEHGVRVDPRMLPPKRREFVRWLQTLLLAMAERPAFYGCYGFHEWAMVYRQTPEDRRHNAYPLRFSPEVVAEIVERNALCCSHFDAFRFFTPPAVPLNRLQLTRADALRLEQRGCLHANMDLYKWAFKLAPFTPSELIADCFELARDIREVDMRASPYDLRALGFPPIAIETSEGRSEYERHQREFARRGEPLRARLIGLCARLLGAG